MATAPAACMPPSAAPFSVFTSGNPRIEETRVTVVYHPDPPAGSSFPLPGCTYSLQQPEKSMCSICGTSENLWICLICDHVGCGRDNDCHAIRHWEETQHRHALELETRKVWDYAENNYVHQLMQSKTEAKPEYNCHAGMSGDLLSSKCEAIVKEYKDFLEFQLKNHRYYNESVLLKVKEEIEKEISVATEEAVCLKLRKLQENLAKFVEEKTFLDGVNENLMKDENSWKEKLQNIKARGKASLESKDEVIKKLKEEVADLIARACDD